MQTGDGVHHAGEHGHEQYREQGGQADGFCSVEEDEQVGVCSGMKAELRGNLKSCYILGSKKTYEDFEKKIYLQHSLVFDWKGIDEEILYAI